MKNKRNVKTKLLERTPLEKLFHNLRTFFMLTNRSVLLPSPFYQFLEIFRLLEFSMSLLLTDMAEVWDDNGPFKRIFHFLQIFWRFSADCTDETGLTVSFVVILVLFFALELTVLGIFINFTRTSVITQSASFITCLFQEIIFQILFSWVSSQLGTLVSLIATDSSFRNSFHYVQLVIYIILLIYYIFFSFTLSNNDVSYMKGRSVCWSYKTQRLYVFTTLVNLFLTRLVEMLSKTASLVFSIITIIYVISYIVFLFIFLPYISFSMNSYHIALSISCVVGFIIQLISYHAYHIDSAITVIIAIVLSVALFLIIKQLNENRRRKSIDVLKSIATSEVTFEDSYKNKNSFLMSVRFGFEMGNYFVFTWQPFLSAIEIWPNDRDIWIQWIRFVIIYPDQSRRLEQIMNEFHEKGFKDLSTKYIKSQVKFIQNSRNKHMTRDLKQELSVIDEEILNIKTIVITYWNEISGGSLNSNSSYNIASKLKRSFGKVNTQYLRLLSLYPNNYPIASKYSEFMLNIMSDPVEGQFWENRSKVLKNKVQQVLTDATQEYGFSFFPFIPHSLQGLAEGADGSGSNGEPSQSDSPKHRRKHNLPKTASSLLIPEEEGIENDAENVVAVNMNSKLVDTPIVNENKPSSANLTESNNSNYIDDDISMAPSHFRSLGLNAKVPFITKLIIIAIVFFVVAFICVPFVPPISIVLMLKPYRNQFTILKSISGIRTSMMKVPYYMFFQSMMSPQVLGPMVGSFLNLYQNSTMNNDLKELNDRVQDFHRMVGSTIDINSNSGQYINRTTINYIFKNKNVNVSFLEGLDTISSSILKFDNPLDFYMQYEWFMFIFDNIDRIENSLGTLSQILCDDMNDYRDKSINAISIILYVFIAAEVIIIPVFIAFTANIRKNWNYIVNTINSIPRVAIQKVIQKYSNENSKNKNNQNDHKNFKSEFRYQLSLVQMVSSRDTSGGIPIKSIIIIFFIVFIISIACVIAVIQIMDITKKDLTHVPMQYYSGSNGIYAVFKLISVFLIKGYIDFSNLRPGSDTYFGSFNKDYIYRGISFISRQMSTTLDEVVFGSSDYPQKGILHSTKEILELLTKSNGNPYGLNDTITELDIRQFPHFVGLELFYESNYGIIEKVATNVSYNFLIHGGMSDMLTVLTTSTLGTFSLVPLFLDVYVERTSELFNDSMDKINMILFLLGAGLFVLGVFAISCLIVMIINVKKTVQFALSMLSMVDPSYVQEMQNVMNLFYGKTSGTVQTNQTLQRTFNEVESLVPECPLELNSQMIINSINDKLIEMWELDPEQAKGSHISLILTFNDKSVLDQLTQQANGQKNPKEPRKYNTSITLNASKRVINTSFTSYYVPRSKETKLVLMFGSNLETEEKGKNIDQLTKENNEIKIESIPEGLRNKVDLDADRKSFTSHYLVFEAIELMNLNEFYDSNHSAKEVHSFYKNFENKVKEMCKNQNIDATYLKSIGSTFIIGFNFIQQNTNYYKSAQESFEFVKELNSFASANNYEIRCCSTSTKNATSLLISKNTLKFDVYSDEIQSLLLMLKSSEKDKLLFPAKMRDFMPPDISSEAEEVEIIQFNKESEWGYKLNISANKPEPFII